MIEIVEREEVLRGATYKIRPNGSDFSYYITINSQLVEGKLLPRELFINTKHADHYEHLAALSRIISAVFRLSDDSMFIAKELQEIFSPVGGYRKKSKYYNSFYNEIGECIEMYLSELTELNNNPIKKNQ